MVLVDSEQSIEEAGAVLERGFEVGVAEDVA
jgi:hypothetical protein